MIKGLPDDFRYENGLVVANGDHVLLHGRFSGIGLPANWILADIVRLENGKLAEHWDVIQDEVKKGASRSVLPESCDKAGTKSQPTKPSPSRCLKGIPAQSKPGRTSQDREAYFALRILGPPFGPSHFTGSASGLNDSTLFSGTKCPTEVGQRGLDQPRL
jgi:hypothetical protein